MNQFMKNSQSRVNHTFMNGISSIRMLLEQKKSITAVLAGNDEIAHGVWDGLWEAGLDVPRDVSLIGFDDQHGMARLQSLTSVLVDAMEIGRQLAKMPVAIIKSKGQHVPEMLLSPALVRRGTCRPLLQIDTGNGGNANLYKGPERRQMLGEKHLYQYRSANHA